MNVQEEKRDSVRYAHDASIVYAYHNSDEFFNATMCNFCKDGMCFTSRLAIEPGSDIYIMMEDFSADSVGSEIYNGYLAEVRWCQQQSDVENFSYKIGVKYYQTLIGQHLDS